MQSFNHLSKLRLIVWISLHLIIMIMYESKNETALVLEIGLQEQRQK